MTYIIEFNKLSDETNFILKHQYTNIIIVAIS